MSVVSIESRNSPTAGVVSGRSILVTSVPVRKGHWLITEVADGVPRPFPPSYNLVSILEPEYWLLAAYMRSHFRFRHV